MGRPIFKRGERPSSTGDGGTTFIGRGTKDDTKMASFPFGWDLESRSGNQEI